MKRKLIKTGAIFRFAYAWIMKGGSLSLIIVLLAGTGPVVCYSYPTAVEGRAKAVKPQQVEKPEGKPETVSIGGEEYVVPEPWVGHRITAPKFEYSDFSKIPIKFTHNESKIYILDIAHQPLVDLLEAAKKDGILLQVESAYRSERYQKKIFKRMLAEDRTFDDIVRYVAPPGYSEHMLGRAVDFFPSNWDFAELEAYQWLQKNANRFGFEETYSQYNPMKMPWEAWHWNYTDQSEDSGSVSQSRTVDTGLDSQVNR